MLYFLPYFICRLAKKGDSDHIQHILQILLKGSIKKRKILWLKDLFMRQCCRVMTDEDVSLFG